MQNTGILKDASGGQTNCNVVYKEDCIFLYPQVEGAELLIWNLNSLDSIELNGATLVARYKGQTLECMGEIARTIHYAKHSALTNQTKKKRSGVKAVYTVVLLVIGVGLLFFAAVWFWLIPWLGEKAATLVPVDVEIEMGESLAKTYSTQNNINDSASYFIQQFTKELDIDTVYPIDVKVISSPEINAFALPGGKIFVYSGIINKMKSYEELVALLGHEATHVMNRHSLKSVCRNAAASIAIQSLLGDVGGISAGILQEADRFKELDYSRDLETEADNNGLQIMLRNKVNPAGMLNLLKLLQKEGAEMPQLMKYLSTHPDTADRIENIASQQQVNTVFPKDQHLEELFKRLQNSLLSNK